MSYKTEYLEDLVQTNEEEEEEDCYGEDDEEEEDVEEMEEGYGEEEGYDYGKYLDYSEADQWDEEVVDETEISIDKNKRRLLGNIFLAPLPIA
jgi:hypothetical protein